MTTPHTEYVRIGRPPTAPPARQSNTVRNALAVALAVCLALLGVAAYMFATRPAVPNVAAAEPAQIQLECDSITREYQRWGSHTNKLAAAAAGQAATATQLEGLSNDVLALEKAVSGHKDVPAKDLYIAVLVYKWELGMAILQNQLNTDGVKPEQRQRAVAAASAVDVAYKRFDQQTCGSK